MGLFDSLFGKPEEADTSVEDAKRAQALREAGLASDQFIAGGAPVYDQGQQYTFNELGQLEQLGPSEMQNIQTDPRLMQAQYDALRELETRGREGFTARDELDRLKTKQQVGKENAGRMGAIQQNMAARGMGGSGLDLVAQLAASQAATEREALAGLERNAAQEANRANSSAQAGSLAGNIRGQGFQENSAKAQAQDLINRFNTQNSVNRQQYNNQGLNRTNAGNVDRYNQTMDRNTEGQYGFRKDALGVRQGQQQMNYNAATEDLNQKRIKDQQAAAKRQAQISGITTLAGAGLGAAFAGPGGAMQGASYGAGIGNAAGGAFYAKGGKVPEGKDCYASGGYVNAPEVVPWDDEINDVKQINVSGGEIVIPKSIANDPLASAQFVDHENRKAMNQARSRQDMYGLGNVLGKAATDYGNAQNPDVILANRMQDLGQAPSVFKSEKRQFDGSVFDNMGKQGVDRASEDAARNEKAFTRDSALRDEAPLRDPNSIESISAREFLLGIAPGIREKIPNFDQLNAKSVGRIAPGYQNKYEMDQKAADRKADAAQRRDQFDQTLGVRKDEAAYRNAALGQSRAEKETQRLEKETQGTATQNAARGFGKRIEDANAIFDKIERDGYDRSSISSGIGSVLPNIARSANAQMQDQAERNFVNALLRKESGAAIGESEFESAQMQYFPRAGDTEEVLAQKRANRERAVDSLKRESGKTWEDGRAKSDQTGTTGSWEGNDEAASQARQKRIIELKAKAGK